MSLCGPILFVDPESRALIANQPDAYGTLTHRDGVYLGTLPMSENLPTRRPTGPVTHWTEMIWALPDDRSRRATLMLHELFYRIQEKLPFAPMRNASNAHLATLNGRYTMLLEYRALNRALSASNAEESRSAIADALSFRADRYHIFSAASGAILVHFSGKACQVLTRWLLR